MRRIYLDHTATTPLDPAVREAMEPYFAGTFGNASSIHWFGREAKSALEKARQSIASVIHAEPGELFFTSGGTESDNLAIAGSARAGRRNGRVSIVTSRAEHHAVLESCAELKPEGFSVNCLPVNDSGSVEIGVLREALSLQTTLVSIMHSNNEVGTISRVGEIAAAVHEHGAVFHSDAVQSLGKVPLDVDVLGVDLMSLSAHKLYGPKGIGALYIRRGTEVEPLLHGGGQERGKRPGTENVALAVGFARAAERALETMEEESLRLMRLRDQLQCELMESFPSIIVNGHPLERLPHILNVSFPRDAFPLEGEMLLVNMDLKGIALTSGSACTSGSMQPSHVLLAMGRDPETAKATLRFAFGKGNSEDDVRYVVETLRGIVTKRPGGG